MRVLVTGGAGYVGSHTVTELLGQGHEVCVFDNYVNASPHVINRIRALTNAPLQAHEGDIRDAPSLETVMAAFAPEAVIHFAGLKAVAESQGRPLDYYDVNVGGTLSLLRAMDQTGCKRLIFSSSATVYGEPEYLPYDEVHPLNPMNVYGRTKLIAERLIADWAQTAGTAALLRYFNPVGAHSSARLGEDPLGTPDNLMPFVAQVAIGRRESVSVFGDDYATPDGTGRRDYIHVVDLARAHVAALDWVMREEGARPFNIGTGASHSVLEVIDAFASAFGRHIPRKIMARRDGDIAEMQADPSRAQAELGWRATLGLDEMVASAWDWQVQNPDGYKADA